MLGLLGCSSPVAAVPTPTSVPTPTVVPTLRPTRLPPTPTALAARTTFKTFHTNISLETYETEETVSLELSQLPGVATVNVTQLDVTVQYDPARLSEDDILRTLRNNPEVRIRNDNSGQ